MSLNRSPHLALKDLLRRPLQFGDADQIECVFILGIAEELIGQVSACRECDGSGEIDDDGPGECDKCGRECSHCSSDGTKECKECEGEGFAVWTHAEVWRVSGKRILYILGLIDGHNRFIDLEPLIFTVEPTPPDARIQ